MAFSSDGKLLVSVGDDNDHAVAVWNWRKAERIAAAKGGKTQLHTAVFKPSTPKEFATIGDKTLLFWQIDPVTSELKVTKAIFSTGKAAGKSQFVEALVFVPVSIAEGMAVTGMRDGDLYVWRGAQLLDRVIGHANGGTTALLLHGFLLFSAGADRCIKVWNFQLGEVRQNTAPLQIVRTIDLSWKLQDQPGCSQRSGKACITAFGVPRGPYADAALEKLYIGTSFNEIFALHLDSQSAHGT